MIPFAYSARNLIVRKTTTIATATGLGLVVFVFASVLMLSNSIDRTMARSAGPDIAIVLRKGSEEELSSNIEEPTVNVILSGAEVARANDGAPRGVGEVVVVILLDKTGTDGFSNVGIRGVPDGVLLFRPEIRIVAGRAPRPGTDEVMVGRSIRGRFDGVDLGQSFSLRKNRPVNVVGVFAAEGSSFESEVWGDLHTVQSAFGREGLVSSARVKLTSPSKFDSFRTSVEENPQLGLTVRRESEYYEKLSQGTSRFISVMGIIVAFFFSIGAMIGAMITMHASVANRQREIGTLRALGFSRSSIVASVLIEGILLSLAGGLLGAAASLSLGFVKFSIINFASWSEMVFSFEPTVAILAGSMVFAAAMGLLGGFFPALRASRLSPIEAMRG